MQSSASQASIISQIDAVGAVTSYLREVRRQADQGKKVMLEAEEVLEELRTSEVAE